ncbi:MAG: prepilin peptidase [Anaerolineales bacterium]|nr:prepilin peptidase [Anaerolineales bacterium]MCB0027984.1 prepilin peptidase [Anaerolineales bacterium]
MIHLIYAFIGLVLAGAINWLADVLPVRSGVMKPGDVSRAPGPAGWLALTQRLFPAGRAYPVRRRYLTVELGMVAIFAILPLLIPNRLDLAVNGFYIAVLILVIVTDLEHRLIFNIVTYPMTLIAIGLAFVVGDNQPTSALLGALTGFLIFYLFYWVGQIAFGPGALGFGDVSLALMMGAMLGLHRIVFALVLGILFGGAVSLILIVTRQITMRSRTAYGPYLAVAGILMLIWGIRVLDWYLA